MTAPDSRLGSYSRLRIGDGVEYFLCFKRFSIAYIDAVKNKSRRLPWMLKPSVHFSRRKSPGVTCDIIQSTMGTLLSIDTPLFLRESRSGRPIDGEAPHGASNRRRMDDRSLFPESQFRTAAPVSRVAGFESRTTAWPRPVSTALTEVNLGTFSCGPKGYSG
jgi:hypothetical protein